MGAGVQAGAGRAEITPPPGRAMAGYMARRGVALGTHDPLYARALVLRRGGSAVGLVSCDVVGLDREVVGRIEGAGRRLGLERVLVAATHTHSGPAGLAPPFDPEVVEILEVGALAALEEAAGEVTAARVGHGSARAPGVALNRRDPARPVENVVRVLRVDARDGRPIAGLVHFACHPTVLGHENLLYSADYPGAAVRVLEERMGGGVALFLNGSAGDVSTRFTRREASFAEAERLGAMVGDAAAAAWGSSRPEETGALGVAAAEVRVPARDLPGVPEAEEALRRAGAALEVARAAGVTGGQLRVLETAQQGARRALEMARCGLAVEPFELLSVRVGDNCLVTCPGELFNEYATVLQSRFQTPVLLVGYANGRAGYLPTPAAAREGGYEVDSSPYAPDAGDRVVRAAAELVRGQLAGARP